MADALALRPAPARPRRPKLPAARLVGRQLTAQTAARLGQQILDARRRRRWPQRRLCREVGISQAYLSLIERGGGRGVPLEIWYALATALGIHLRLELGRDPREEPVAAGHLQMQELVLRLGRAAGYTGGFELPTRPSNPAYSVDAPLRDDIRRILLINECWNTIGDFGAGVRSTRKKVAQAEELAVAMGGERGPYRVAACWVVRDTARNRELVNKYPEVLAAAFPGSSRTWVRALTDASVEPPHEMGLVWCDRAITRLRPWRRRPG